MAAASTTSLATLYKTYPELLQGLCKETLTSFAASKDGPFKSDLEYLQLCDAIFDANHNFIETSDTLRSAINGPKNDSTSGDLPNVKALVKLAQGYNELHEYGLNLMRHRLEAHKTSKTLEPRTARLGKKVQLSEKETYAMAYIVLTQVQMLTYRWGRTYDFAEMARACCMNVVEAMHFVSHSRTHVKEGVISPSEDDPFGYSFQVQPYTTVCVLAGLELSEDILLKIDKTVLAEVLVEEGNKAYSMLTVGTAEERKAKIKKADKDSDPFSFDSDSDKEDKKKDDKKDSDSEKDEEEMKDDDDKDDFDFAEKKDAGDDKDIFEMLRDEIQKEKGSKDDEEEREDAEVDKQKMQPYTTNTAYLSDHIEWLSVLLRVKLMTQEMVNETTKDVEKEAQIRSLQAKERMWKTKCEKRLAATVEANKWMPRLEKLVSHLQLCHFEKMVLLVLTANVLSPKISPDDSRYNSRVSNFTVGNLMGLFADGFEQEIESRKFFYKNSKLVKQGLLRLEDSYRNTELMLDFIVGLDTEFSELVEGSHLYTSSVKLDRVILPERQKSHIVESVKNFEQLQKAKKRLNLDEFMSYGAGMVLLFYGKSGTGKTMMANAIANMLGKRILLINYPSLSSRDSEILIKYIFREAKLTDSILFFDECENIFQSRDRSDSAVNLLLTELEMHNHLVIMATNRQFDLDEAMHRRITLAVEFKVPNPRLRRSIWQAHVPDSVALDKDVNLEELALKFELSGGFIKNTVMAALSSAVARNSLDPVITMADLSTGAEHQLRARLAMVEFDNRVIPDRGLNDLVVSPEISAKLRRIIQMEKARQVLYSEWGYSEKGTTAQGTAILFHGPPGSGKTFAAEALAFEIGKPLLIEVANRCSKGDFDEAAKNDAIPVYKQGDHFFRKQTNSDGSVTKTNDELDTVLYNMERFRGVSIVIANSMETMDPDYMRRFKFIVEFKLPDEASREKLWKKMLPPQAPVADDVIFKTLATKYKFSGGMINNACFTAAATAALRMTVEDQKIKMEDLVNAAEEESGATLPETLVFV